MSNNQKKKLSAEMHNKSRAEQKAKQEAYELDRLENPDKYKVKRGSRGINKFGVYYAMAMAGMIN